MRIKFFAAVLASLIAILLPLPSWADWKHSLLRYFGPTLINRGVNYLLSERGYRPTAPRARTVSPAVPRQMRKPAAPKSQNVDEYIPPSRKTSDYIPPPPNLDVVEAPKSLPRSSKLNVPPPPKTLVPPPPPGVPTGAVLGLYPADLNYVPSEVPAKPSTKPAQPAPPEDFPKVAPDFRKAHR